MVKEASGRDSPAEWSEPVEGGVEVTLRLRLSSTCKDVELCVYSKHTVAQCKNKLHVSFNMSIQEITSVKKDVVNLHSRWLVEGYYINYLVVLVETSFGKRTGN